MKYMMDDFARKLKPDPLQVRLANLRPMGYVEKGADMCITADGLPQCLKKGAGLIGWDEKYQCHQKKTTTR